MQNPISPNVLMWIRCTRFLISLKHKRDINAKVHVSFATSQLKSKNTQGRISVFDEYREKIIHITSAGKSLNEPIYCNLKLPTT